jgi:hypothetical protein
MTDQPSRAGGCICGQVRFVATGAPVNVRVCHCTLCQRAMAGPFFARALYDAPQVALTGETIGFHTSPDLRRFSCARCGGRVGAERLSAARIALSLATFDAPHDLAPDCHFFTSTKAPWLVLGDGMPQYEERPPG